MEPCEAFNGRKYRTPLCWLETGENLILGLDYGQIESNSY